MKARCSRGLLLVEPEVSNLTAGVGCLRFDFAGTRVDQGRASAAIDRWRRRGYTLHACHGRSAAVLPAVDRPPAGTKNMNPELQRNLWLEVTPHRLWMIPLVLLATAALTWPPGETLMLTALVGFTMIWGPRQAADAVIDEARERTWDIQRMASLHPWSMTWGKLAGATVMSWYGAAWCGAILLAAAAPDEREERLTTVVIVVLVR